MRPRQPHGPGTAAATAYYRQLLALTSEANGERPAVAAARTYLQQ